MASCSPLQTLWVDERPDEVEEDADRNDADDDILGAHLPDTILSAKYAYSTPTATAPAMPSTTKTSARSIEAPFSNGGEGGTSAVAFRRDRSDADSQPTHPHACEHALKNEYGDQSGDLRLLSPLTRAFGRQTN